MTALTRRIAETAPYTAGSGSGGRAIGVVNMADLKPIVFVVDDDISVRESLELLIKSAGWRAETFESAHHFLSRPRASVPSCG